jgi:hypothetical protein
MENGAKFGFVGKSGINLKEKAKSTRSSKLLHLRISLLREHKLAFEIIVLKVGGGFQ